MLLSDGMGSFKPPQIYPIAGGVGAVVVTSLTPTGRADIVIGGVSTATVTYLKSDGTGSFATTTGASLGMFYNLGVAVGDVNGDGKADVIAVSAGLNNSALVLLGDGTGRFAATATPATIGDAGTRVLLADFNRDGKLDLAVSTATMNDLRILLGDGAGHFGAATSYPLGAGRPVVCDVDGDGNLDLVQGQAQLTQWLRGDGTGKFSLAQLAVGGNGLTVGDVNGDGLPDLATTWVADLTGHELVQLWLNDDRQLFLAPPSLATGAYAGAIAAADFNQDRLLDLVVADAAGSDVKVFWGRGLGRFGAAQTYAVDSYPVAVAVGDLNQDGIPDLAVSSASSTKVLFADPSGHLGGTLSFAVGSNAGALTLADVNRDGKLDLVTANGSSLTVLFGDGAGGLTLGPTEALTVFSPTLVVADFDGDGVLDVAAADNPASACCYTGVVMKGDGRGHFTLAFTQQFATAPRILAAADLDGDGRTDILLPGLGAVWRNDGAMHFTLHSRFSASDAVQAQDLDGDGRPELITADGVAVTVLANLGFADLAPAQRFPIRGGVISMLVADFTGVGRPDLAFSAAGEVLLLRNQVK